MKSMWFFYFEQKSTFNDSFFLQIQQTNKVNEINYVNTYKKFHLKMWHTTLFDKLH